MQILITNDDGIDSPGLAAMARAASRRGHDVLVVAPAIPTPGNSAALGMRTQRGDVVQQVEHPDGMPTSARCLVAEATPAQIVFLAAANEFGVEPDMVAAGINIGANTGHSIIHSGTLGAALTATWIGLRTMAVSLAGGAVPRNWAAAEAVTTRVMEWFEFQQLERRFLNLNIPDVPLDQLRGLRAAPLAQYTATQGTGVELTGEDHLPRTVPLRYSPPNLRDEPGSDHYLLERNWATATVLRPLVEDFSGLELPSFDKLDPADARLHHEPTHAWSE